MAPNMEWPQIYHPKKNRTVDEKKIIEEFYKIKI